MHNCKMTGPIGNYGVAVERCYKDKDGRFIIDNGEYVQQVNYCPECGIKAPTQIEPYTSQEDSWDWRHLD